MNSWLNYWNMQLTCVWMWCKLFTGTFFINNIWIRGGGGGGDVVEGFCARIKFQLIFRLLGNTIIKKQPQSTKTITRLNFESFSAESYWYQSISVKRNWFQMIPEAPKLNPHTHTHTNQSCWFGSWCRYLIVLFLYLSYWSNCLFSFSLSSRLI